MPLLSREFTILQYCGALRPHGWSSGSKKYLYSVFTMISIFCIYTFVVSELIEFWLSFSDADAAATNCFMTLTILGVCYKLGNCAVKRDNIVNVAEMLDNEMCRPCGHKEIAIQIKFDKRQRINTLIFSGIAAGAVAAITIGAFLVNAPQRTLPFTAWLPFDCSNDFAYWIAFLHQIFAHAVAATIGAFHDALFHAFMIQACAQLNILKSRLHSLPKITGDTITRVSIEMRERREVRKCIRYHQNILRFVELSNGIFSIVIFIQFSVSVCVICASTYMLSKTKFFTSEFIFLIVYLGCMLLQIFLMCWHGNEVITESCDVGTAIYRMDWSSLKQNTKKDLRLIMARAQDSIRYTSGSVITLSLDSYNSLMKLTYSLYNLLQQSSS